MTSKYTGGCKCGNITYVVNGEPQWKSVAIAIGAKPLVVLHSGHLFYLMKVI